MSPAKLAPGTCPPTAGTRVPHTTSQPTVLGTVLRHARPVSEQEVRKEAMHGLSAERGHKKEDEALKSVYKVCN